MRRGDVDHPDELRVDLDPQPGVRSGAVRQVAWRSARCWPSTAGRLPEDVGLPRHPHQRPDRAPLGLQRRAAGRAGPGPGGGAAACPKSRPSAGGRRSAASGSSSTTTRTPATARSRRRTRCAPTPRGGSRARSTGTRSTDIDPADLTLATVPARYAARGDPGAGIDDAAVLPRLAARAGRPRRGGGAGRRAVAAPLPQAARRARPGAAEPGPPPPVAGRALGAGVDAKRPRRGVRPLERIGGHGRLERERDVCRSRAGPDRGVVELHRGRRGRRCGQRHRVGDRVGRQRAVLRRGRLAGCRHLRRGRGQRLTGRVRESRRRPVDVPAAPPVGLIVRRQDARRRDGLVLPVQGDRRERDRARRGERQRAAGAAGQKRGDDTTPVRGARGLFGLGRGP